MAEEQVTFLADRPSKRRARLTAAAIRTQNISRSAERLSRCSNPADYYYEIDHPSSAFKAIALYGALLAMSNSDIFLTEESTKKLANRAFSQNYQSQWGLLQDFLEQTINALEFEEKMFQSFTPQVIYGNLLPEIARQMCAIKARPRGDRKSGPIAKKVRRRGYRDKGTLRSVESRARVAADIVLAIVENDPLKEDRRPLVKHPMLKKEAIAKYEGNSLRALSALEEMYEAAEEYLKGEDRDVDTRRRVERIKDIVAAFIGQLEERISANQPPDRRTQNQES